MDTIIWSEDSFQNQSKKDVTWHNFDYPKYIYIHMQVLEHWQLEAFRFNHCPRFFEDRSLTTVLNTLKH